MDEPAPLSINDAAGRLGLPTVEVLWLMRIGELRYVLINELPHVPASAIDEYRRDHPI